MVTVRLMDDERTRLSKISFLDANGEWKYMAPFYYRWKPGYWEVYDSEEYKAATEKIRTPRKD